MTTRDRDASVRGPENQAREKAACSFGEPAVSQDGLTGRMGARHVERLAGRAELEIREL